MRFNNCLLLKKRTWSRSVKWDGWEKGMKILLSFIDFWQQRRVLFIFDLQDVNEFSLWSDRAILFTFYSRFYGNKPTLTNCVAFEVEIMDFFSTLCSKLPSYRSIPSNLNWRAIPTRENSRLVSTFSMEEILVAIKGFNCY